MIRFTRILFYNEDMAPVSWKKIFCIRITVYATAKLFTSAHSDSTVRLS